MTMIRVGSRGSALALWQARWVAARIGEVTGTVPEIVTITTAGDRDQSSALRDFGGAGAFTRGIDAAQRAGRFEVSVHSLKDLPTEGREGLVLAAVPTRAPVEDCLVSASPGGLDGLPQGALVGTGSARRRAQLLRLRPDLRMTEIRGNVDTRIAKVREGEVQATLLARAGLVRLGLEDEISEVLSTDRMLPAAAQGALGIVVREDADECAAIVARLQHDPTRAAADAERAVLHAMGGGCHLPVGVFAEVREDRMSMRARVVSADGANTLEDEAEGLVADAAAVGRGLGERLVAAGAMALMD